MAVSVCRLRAVPAPRRRRDARRDDGQRICRRTEASLKTMDDIDLGFTEEELAAIEAARIAWRERMEPTQVVTRAGTLLRMARLGLEDLATVDEDRALFGFLGVVVYGRSMTLIMQHLRTYDEVAFDDWYQPWRDEMTGDPVCLYLADLRTKIVHHHSPGILYTLYAHGRNSPQVGSIRLDGVEPPAVHLGEPISDTSTMNLCRLYVAYLGRMFDSFAPIAFAVQDVMLAREPT